MIFDGLPCVILSEPGSSVGSHEHGRWRVRREDTAGPSSKELQEILRGNHRFVFSLIH